MRPFIILLAGIIAGSFFAKNPIQEICVGVAVISISYICIALYSQRKIKQ
jgi:hypothetical protein